MKSARPVLDPNRTAPMAQNAAALPYNNTFPNNKQSVILPSSTQLPQHQQYQQPQQGRKVSPVVSPEHRRELTTGNANHAVHLQHPIGSGNVNINHHTMTWQPQHQQQQQQHPQLNTCVSHESEENRNTDNDSDVSSIPWGSIRPDPNYDPAKDPMRPENIDKPFVAPLEITIRVVKGRRRKAIDSCTISSYHSTTTNSTTITPPQQSATDDDKQQQQQQWLSSPDPPTTQTGSTSIPLLGQINSFESEGTDSQSFSESFHQLEITDDRVCTEDRLYLLEEIQSDHLLGNSDSKQRKGMVRREFNRRIRRFRKKKPKNKNNIFLGENEYQENDASGNKIIIDLNPNDNVNNTYEQPKQLSFKKKSQAYASPFGGRIKHRRSKSLHESDASGNKIIIDLNPNDNVNNTYEQPKPISFKKKSQAYVSPFGGRTKHHRSKSLRLIVGQENGC